MDHFIPEEKYMRRAIELAKRGSGRVNPNPLVGAVIVKGGQTLGEGWHECYGQEHPAICRMLEIWDYLGASFPGCERKVRKIRKARDLQTYRRFITPWIAALVMRNGMMMVFRLYYVTQMKKG